MWMKLPSDDDHKYGLEQGRHELRSVRAEYGVDTGDARGTRTDLG